MAMSGGQYVLTELGQNTLDASTEHPWYVEDTNFELDVLWPTKHNLGKRIEFDGIPVLPTRESMHSCDPEWPTINLIDQVQLIEESISSVMKRYGYNAGEAIRYHDENRISICDNCGMIGVFRLAGSGNLRNKCTICEGKHPGAQ